MRGTYDDASEVTDYDDEDLEAYDRYIAQHESFCEDHAEEGYFPPQSFEQWRAFRW